MTTGSFDLPQGWPTCRVVLRFDGVDSCFRAWLNGSQIGTEAGSRLPVEFDVTEHVRADRPNVLAVRVHQWSSGSYLEDQDMWWLSGIFRPITVLARPHGGIGDYFVYADYDHTTGRGTPYWSMPAVTSPPARGCPCRNSASNPGRRHRRAAHRRPLVGRGASAVCLGAGQRARVRAVADRLPQHLDRDSVLRINGRRVIFRGVNRHEFHPQMGRALTEEVMLADVLLMKRHNINAVRTSHYPPHPRFLELCDDS